MRHIERDGYHILDWPDQHRLKIRDLWKRFPEIVVGRYLVNTSFDSGLLPLSILEREVGWRMFGQLVHSPKICSVDQIPYDQYDEWLIFDHPVQVDRFETLVNYGGFSPIEFEKWGSFEYELKWEHYWDQIIQLQPLHVIAENEGAYIVSRDECLIRKIIDAVAAAEE